MAAQMPEGLCALCRNVRELRDSHYLPKAFYKRLRDPGEKNPNPILVTAAGKVATSMQVTDYLLCAECEDRFNRNGEKARTPEHRQYKFLVPGLGFEMFVGKAILESVRAMCVIRSPQGFLVTSDKMEEATLAEMAKLVLKPKDQGEALIP